MPDSPPQALAGIRVLDLSRVLAGPFCSMLLADLGAEVIKIESALGDETRTWGPPWNETPSGPQSAYFQCVNRNKKSRVIDLKSEEGKQQIRKMAAQTHVLIENFKPGKMAEFGLDYPQLRRLNPALVYCSISGFGQEGPYRDRPGYDSVIQAMSGLMSITGAAGGPPTKVGVAVSDVLSGLFAAFSVLAAVRHAERTGTGQWLDVSLFDCQVAALVNVAANYLSTGATPKRHGNQHPNIVPYQPFEASDGAFMLAVGNDSQFARLCRLLDLEELANDEHYTTNAARSTNRDRLIPILQARFLEGTVDHWVERLLAAGIPAGPTHDLAQLFADPHFHSRELVQQLGNFKTIRHPVRYSQTPATLRAAPPDHDA